MVAPGHGLWTLLFSPLYRVLLEIASYKVGPGFFIPCWFDGCLTPSRPVPIALKI